MFGFPLEHVLEGVKLLAIWGLLWTDVELTIASAVPGGGVWLVWEVSSAEPWLVWLLLVGGIQSLGETIVGVPSTSLLVGSFSNLSILLLEVWVVPDEMLSLVIC